MSHIQKDNAKEGVSKANDEAPSLKLTANRKKNTVRKTFCSEKAVLRKKSRKNVSANRKKKQFYEVSSVEKRKK